MASISTGDPALTVPHSALVVDDRTALRSLSANLIYVALGVIFVWFGLLKFTPYEAQAIGGLIANNPLLAWLHGLFGVQGGARFLGVVEVLAGVLILCRWFNPRLSAIGGAMAMLTFFFTLTCMLSTPGVSAMEAGGFPVLSADVGQFLLKDIGLFAASFFIVADSMAVDLLVRRRIIA